MSKYIIDIPKTVGMGEVGSVHYTYFDGIQCKTIVIKSDEIEELNSDYINEHYGDLQDTAYQKGFEDGKAQREHDDKIEVGDEVEWDNDFTGDRFIVTRIYQLYGKKEQCDGIDDDGDVYRAVLIESLVKTGRHFDIASILEEMKHD